MTEPVSMTTEQFLQWLQSKVVKLQMECEIRAQREDALNRRIAELEKPEESHS